MIYRALRTIIKNGFELIFPRLSISLRNKGMSFMLPSPRKSTAGIMQYTGKCLGMMIAIAALTPTATPGQSGAAAREAGRFGGGGGDLGSYANRVALGITYERMPVNISSNNLSNPAGINFSDADMKVAAAQSNGIHKFGIIAYEGNGYWPPATNLGPVVARYVERYDGDGIDDMPGLAIPVKHWEIFNEYTTNWSGYAGCTEAMYARYLSNAYVWAHGADTGVTVIASAVATARDSRAQWYLARLLTNTWVTNYFDAMNYHAYEDFYPFTNGPAAQPDYLFIRDFKDFLAGYGLADRELWATETDFSGTYMNGGQTASQDDNARYLARSYPFALACGVDRIFYTELEYNSHFPAHLNWAVLTDSAGNRRKVFYVLQTMIEKLEGFTSAALQDFGGANLGAQFTVNGRPVWVVWNYSNVTSQVALPAGTNSLVRITQALPAAFDNSSASWTVTTGLVSGGYALVDTGGGAVYAEPFEPEPVIIPGPPANVAASDGTYTDKVRITWEASGGATGYRVYRGADDSEASAGLIGTTGSTAWDDTGAAADATSFYRVKAENSAGQSAFSAPDFGFTGTIGPLITANGMVGTVQLESGDALEVAVQVMNSEAYAGAEVDWWVIAFAHSGAWYYLNSAMQWELFSGDLGQCRPAYQGPLFNLPITPVLSGFIPSGGTYDFWFAVDYPMDGNLNPAGPILYKKATVRVE